MEINDLFRTRDGRPVTADDFRRALESVGAHEAQVLYMHTELSFGTPNPGIGRRDLLAKLYAVVRNTGVPTICVPTFTFSFCNGVDYDVQRSRSQMGALNEYIRNLPEAVRSADPLMSSAVVGPDTSLVTDVGRRSIGANSTFDRLHRRPGVRFLFFGASPSKCFTYIHYVEECERVYYRYDRSFAGNVTDRGHTTRETYTLFVRYRNVVLSDAGQPEQEMARRGILRRAACGDAVISCADEPGAYDTIVGQLRSDINCYLAPPYPGEFLDREFRAHNMVAL